MKALLSAVFWRYVALAVQFGVVLLIVRRTPIDVAGHYFAIFGFVTVTAIAVGLGIPDGLVRDLRAYQIEVTANLVRKAVLRSVGCSVVISLVLAVPVVLTVVLVSSSLGVTDIFLAGLWWMAYSAAFLLAEVLVSLQRAAMGAFVAYSSIGVGYAFTVVPYTLMVDVTTLRGLLAAANAGAWSASLIGWGLVIKALADLRDDSAAAQVGSINSTPSLSIWRLFVAGFPMMVSRFMQASLPWIPVWMLIALASAEEAAVYAAASRLVVPVTSVVAALRFSARPAIVELNRRQEFKSIAGLNRRCSLLSAAPPLIGLGGLLVGGGVLIPTILGPDYAQVTNVLIVLMLGVLAEAFGGMSDEILKMTGRTEVVVKTLVLAILFQAACCYALSGGGAPLVAYATVGAFAIQYVGQVIYLSSRTPIQIVPMGLWRRHGRV